MKKNKYSYITKLYDRRNKTTLEKITAWYLDKESGIDLTEKEQVIRKRWSAAYSLLCQYHSPQQAVQVLKTEFNISEPQAYRDVKNATKLFGDVSKSEKEGYRHILYEYSMKVFQMAAKNHDLQNMNKAITNMISLKGLDVEDPDIPNFEKLQPHQYNINLPDATINILSNMINKGAVNLSDFNHE